ncbi:saccharopine dehydrogenase family protein [Haladaptatus sp. NG-WS-4]
MHILLMSNYLWDYLLVDDIVYLYTRWWSSFTIRYALLLRNRGVVTESPRPLRCSLRQRGFYATTEVAYEMADSSILVAGGYGSVGSYISAELASTVPGDIIIGGRDQQKSSELAAKLGDDVGAEHLDVTDDDSIDSALDGVNLVISTVDQPDARLLRAVVDRGLAFTSTTAVPPIWAAAQSLSERAEETGARVVLGAGIQPGISNMLARLGATHLGAVEKVSTALILSIGDEFGPASLSEVMELASHPYEITADGRQKQVSPFDCESAVRFPEPIGERRTYLFPFSDQFYYARTLGAETVTVRFALDPPWLGRLLATIANVGGTSMLTERPLSRRILTEAIGGIHQLYDGQDWFAITVTVGGDNRSVEYTLVDRHQARATGISAATIGRALYEDRVDTPGVWLSEEIIDPEWFFDRLAARNLPYDVRYGTAFPR